MIDNEGLEALYEILLIGNLKGYIEYNGKNINRGVNYTIEIEETVELLRDNGFSVIYGETFKDDIVDLYRDLLGDKYIVSVAIDLGNKIILDIKKKLYVH